MNTRRVALASMVICTLVASLAIAKTGQKSQLNSGSQPAGPGPQAGHRPPPPPSPIIRALDTNKDGELSAEELANAPAALKALDANGDGKLTRDELMPPPPGQEGFAGRPQNGQAPQGHRPPPPPPGGLIRVLDADRNGELSAEEIAGATQALLTLDENGDGQLSRDELRPPPPPNPVVETLDTNKDREISAEEIANAPAALATLDKNGDGKLTRDELMPPPPPADTQTSQASQQ